MMVQTVQPREQVPDKRLTPTLIERVVHGMSGMLIDMNEMGTMEMMMTMGTTSLTSTFAGVHCITLDVSAGLCWSIICMWPGTGTACAPHAGGAY